MGREGIAVKESRQENFGDIPEWPGIIVEGKHIHKYDLTAEILEQAYNEAPLDKKDRIARMIIAYAKMVELDKLTGLSGLHLLRPKLNKLLERLNYEGEHRRHSEIDSILVVSVDLVGFKFFNEAPYNHQKGNEALIAFANRLREVLRREGDSAFRLHGDEFLLVFSVDSNSDSAENLFERVQTEIIKGLHIEGEKDKLDLLIHANFGHTIAKRGDTRTAEQLIHDSDVDERKAKLKTK